MDLPQIKPFLPRSLFGRSLAILLVPIVVLQLVVGLVFFERHYQRVTEQMTRGVALELLYAIARIETAPSPREAAARLTDLAGPLNFDLSLAPGAFEVAPSLAREWLDVTGGALARTLRAELERPLAIDLRADPRAAVIAMPTRAGILRAEIPRSRLSVSNPHQLLVLMIFVALLLVAGAVLFLRNQVRPIRALAEASEAFGKGRSVAFRPVGAEEVRRAGAAFLSMRSRLERQIEQRTQMLSAVSHDLRTPLTRMKLTLALMDETEDASDLRHDLDQMERMLGEFLAFARGETLEATGGVDPFALAAEVAENARRAGKQLTLIAPPAAQGRVEIRAGAVGRALQNLVDNAARHGTRVALEVRLRSKTVEFVVEDDGPGIPAADRPRALSPFTRLDAARNQDSGGGVGLGLSIALDVARSHGGNLELGHSLELGGLRAVLRLPR